MEFILVRLILLGVKHVDILDHLEVLLAEVQILLNHLKAKASTALIVNPLRKEGLLPLHRALRVLRCLVILVH